jgi:predicted regulator of Ras-like GTPase activity (Roadblock/LC7/MglB family)
MADIEVPQPGASEIVSRLLHDAMHDHPDVQWIGLVSEDGFAIASEGAGGHDVEGVAAGAVRMMLQMRSLSRSLGKRAAGQMFLEGEDGGICVIDKDPWVLVIVGAPEVPIGLLRFEAREIAGTFPAGRSPELPEGASLYEELDYDPVTTVEGDTEIRWADEPTQRGPDEGFRVEDDIFAQAATDSVEEHETPSAGPEDFSDWGASAPTPAGSGDLFDLPPPSPAAPASYEVPSRADDLFDLPPPTGSPIDLPPPVGPAFDLPPPLY